MGSPRNQLSTSDTRGIVGDVGVSFGVGSVAAMLAMFVARAWPETFSIEDQALMTAGFMPVIGFVVSIVRRYLADTRP